MKKILFAATFLLSFSSVSNASTLGNPTGYGKPPPGRDESQIECLAFNIYHEARGENLAGKFAVADVTLNRTRDKRFPDTICDVVKQGSLKYRKADHSPKINVCQFSWWCDGKSDEPLDEELWAISLDIAYKIGWGQSFRGITEGATHYHATYVDPAWSKDFYIVGRIGNHIFYRWDLD